MKIYRTNKHGDLVQVARETKSHARDRPNTHGIHLHIPDWLYRLIQADAEGLGQRSISGYIVLILARLYEGREI